MLIGQMLPLVGATGVEDWGAGVVGGVVGRGVVVAASGQHTPMYLWKWFLPIWLLKDWGQPGNPWIKQCSSK